MDREWREDHCITQSTFIATPSSLDMWNFGLLFIMKEKRQHDARDTAMKIQSSLSNSSQNSATK